MKVVRKLKEGKKIVGYVCNDNNRYTREQIIALAKENKLENVKLQLYKNEYIIRVDEGEGAQKQVRSTKIVPGNVYRIVNRSAEKSEFMIADETTKGICWCTGYTVKQLIANGKVVNGAKISNGRLSVDVKPNELGRDIDRTLRSATTIMKGIPLTQSQKQEMRQLKAEKEQQLKLQKQMEKERLQKEKELAERRKKMEVCRKPGMLICILGTIDCEASEYNSKETKYYTIEAIGEKSIPLLKKLKKEADECGAGFALNIKEVKEEMARRGKYTFDYYDEKGVVHMCANGIKNMPIVANNTIDYYYKNHYEGTHFEMRLRRSENYRIPEEHKGRCVGSVADGVEIESVTNYLNRLKILKY